MQSPLNPAEVRKPMGRPGLLPEQVARIAAELLPLTPKTAEFRAKRIELAFEFDRTENAIEQHLKRLKDSPARTSGGVSATSPEIRHDSGPSPDSTSGNDESQEGK